MQRNSCVRGVGIGIAVCGVLLVLTPAAFAQQSYVSRYDAYVGYAYLNSSNINLAESGVHTQVGIRPKRWLAYGFDFSRASGSAAITPGLLPTTLQQQLSAQLGQMAAAGMLPAGYTLRVPIDSVTETYAAGPQVSIPRWKYITPFIRPSLGAMHETATPRPTDPIAAAIVKGLAPAGKKQDWTGFYGVGCGFDFYAGKHLRLRAQADFVYDHLFNDILRDGRSTIRFSIGPAFEFGRNVE